MKMMKHPFLLAALASAFLVSSRVLAADTLMKASYSVKVDTAAGGGKTLISSSVDSPSSGLWDMSGFRWDEMGLSSADRLELAKYRDSLAFAEREAVREHEIRKERMRKDSYVPAFVGPLAFFGVFILFGVPFLGLFCYLFYRMSRHHRQEELRLDTIRELARSGQAVTTALVDAINDRTPRHTTSSASVVGHLHQAIGRTLGASTPFTALGKDEAASSEVSPDAPEPTADETLAAAAASGQRDDGLTMADMEYILKKCLIGLLCVVTGYISGIEWFGWILLLVGFYFLAQGGARLWYYHRQETDRRKHKA